MYLPNSASTFPAPVYEYAMPKCLFNMSKQVLYTVPATPTILHVARTHKSFSFSTFHCTKIILKKRIENESILMPTYFRPYRANINQ